MSMFIYVDGDELAYKSTSPKTTWQCGWCLYKTKPQALSGGCKEEDLVKNFCHPYPYSVTKQIDSMINKIVTRCKEHFIEETDFIVQPVISGEGNYRNIHPSYKANRGNKAKPFYLAMAKDYLVSRWNAYVSVDEEADDSMGCLSGENTILASSDKDFLTVPGWLYNIMKDSFIYITEEDSWRNFYTQVMVGDVADNVKGLPKVGPVKAKKILGGIHGKQEMLQRVLKEFIDRGFTERDMETAAFLLYIRRAPGELWTLAKALKGDI